MAIVMAFLMTYSQTGRYTLTKQDKTYVDISLAFTPSPVTKDLTLLTNERAINNALKNIIMTLPSEVVFFRDFGSRTNLYLFDLIDESSAVLLEEEIRRAILFNEPRVSFETPLQEDDLSVAYFENTSSYRGNVSRDNKISKELGVIVIARPEQNEYSVTVRYRIVGTEKIFNVEVLLTPTR